VATAVAWGEIPVAWGDDGEATMAAYLILLLLVSGSVGSLLVYRRWSQARGLPPGGVLGLEAEVLDPSPASDDIDERLFADIEEFLRARRAPRGAGIEHRGVADLPGRERGRRSVQRVARLEEGMDVTHSSSQGEVPRSSEQPVRLLVALEYRDSAAELLRAVAPLARAAHAEVDLLTVLDPQAFHDTPERRVVSEPSTGKDVGWFGVGFGAGYVRIPERREHVVEYASQEAEETHGDALDSLNLLAHEHLVGLDVRLHIEESKDVPEAIMDAAAQAEAGFIVIAGHRERTPLTPVLGGVAQGVLERSSIPVLVVPSSHG
jgi:nucleotide-binding universal stress UspA family protein